MKTETLVHATERAKRATEPVYVLRFFHVPDYGKAESYPFSRNFASRGLNEPSLPILECIARLGGGPAQIVPEQGRSTIGGFQVDCVDLNGEILRYFSNVQLTLVDAITATVPGPGEQLHLDPEVEGLPAFGTIEVGTGETLERIRYSSKDAGASSVIVWERGVDGTTAAAHPAEEDVTNGEQIRPGQRCQLLSGYASMIEADFMPSQLVEIIDRHITDLVRAAYTIDTADITRALRREVFLAATMEAPFIIGGHPLAIALKIILSTGTGTNGVFDVLAAENGLGIPQEFIDVEGILAVAAEFPNDGYCFTLIGPEMAKPWLEDQIFKTINAYPVVLQDGRLTIRLYTPVLT